jgi:hypothetical protein
MIVVFLCISSCTKPDVLQYRPGEYPPKSAGSPIEVLDVDNLDRAHEFIGIVNMSSLGGDAEDTQKALEKMKEEARKMGGDALAIIDAGDEFDGFFGAGARNIQALDARNTFKIRAKVLVWKEKAASGQQ